MLRNYSSLCRIFANKNAFAMGITTAALFTINMHANVRNNKKKDMILATKTIGIFLKKPFIQKLPRLNLMLKF